MITALNRETLSLERTISANCLSGFVQYEPVNVVFGNRNIYAECSIDYAVRLLLPENFMQWFKIGFITPSLAIPLQK